MKHTVTHFFDKEKKLFLPVVQKEFEIVVNSFSHLEKVSITFEKYFRDASRSQINAFNMVCDAIAQYTGSGRDQVREQMKREWGPLNDDGTLMSTTRYNTKQASKLLEMTLLFSQELGIINPKIEQLIKNNI